VLAIQLPFLNSLRSESAEEGDRDSVERGHVVLRWRLPIAGHAHGRLPVHERSPDCINSLTFANGQQPTGSLVAASLNQKNAGFGLLPTVTPKGRRGAQTAEGRVKGGGVVETSPVATARWQYRSAGDGNSTVLIRYGKKEPRGRRQSSTDPLQLSDQAR
jgi:hypothetical protein